MALPGQDANNKCEPDAINVAELSTVTPGVAPGTLRMRLMRAPNGHRHRSVSVKIKGSILAGDTMILAFTGNPHSGGSVGAGGIITGHAPRCVSLPAAP